MMSDAERCIAGGWVEVERVLLDPADRSTNLPADTAAQPLLVWVKGFARAEASVGERVEVETMTGRRVTGRLTEVNPGYTHTFGKPAPELTHVGRDLRDRVAAYRAFADAKAGE
ncbi:MAG: 2-amino-4-oxopentanoate thiolase subunit OrtA [Coriobacteriia bacterium]|nr:2-amino-4-oxopentanoate thiolase subunit OrtA [Coriobacteriia bacterium]